MENQRNKVHCSKEYLFIYTCCADGISAEKLFAYYSITNNCINSNIAINNLKIKIIKNIF